MHEKTSVSADEARGLFLSDSHPDTGLWRAGVSSWRGAVRRQPGDAGNGLTDTESESSQMGTARTRREQSLSRALFRGHQDVPLSGCLAGEAERRALLSWSLIQTTAVQTTLHAITSHDYFPRLSPLPTPYLLLPSLPSLLENETRSSTCSVPGTAQLSRRAKPEGCGLPSEELLSSLSSLNQQC